MGNCVKMMQVKKEYPGKLVSYDMIAIRYNDKSYKPAEYLNFLSKEPPPYDHNMISQTVIK